MIDIIKDQLSASTGTKTTGKPHVVILLDASGSMSAHRESVVSTFNEYVESVKETAHSISLYMFDSSGIREKLCKVQPSRVRKLKSADYVPGAMTPLYDAMGKVMQKFEDSSRNVQFVTHTDGLENHSAEWNYHSLKEYMQILTNKGWLFVHLGEGIEGKEQMSQFQGLKLNFSSGLRGAAIGNLATTTALYSTTCSNSIGTYTSSADGAVNLDVGEAVSSLNE